MVKLLTGVKMTSMTGFATRQGAGFGCDWSWDVRSVNGKGLDLRLRLPEVDGLEGAVREMVGQYVTRGSVSVSLRLVRSGVSEGLRLVPDGLAAALDGLAEVERVARERGITLAPSRGVELMALRGVTELASGSSGDTAGLRKALLLDLGRALRDFAASRGDEGKRLALTVLAQVDRIAGLVEAADNAACARRPQTQVALETGLSRIMGAAPGADPQRVAQELAMLLVKADVTEEIDRLRAHVAAARALVATPGPIGRKFDFLIQELVREANTLCAKSGAIELTAIGLDLKQAIDQMREQVQNVE